MKESGIYILSILTLVYPTSYGTSGDQDERNNQNKEAFFTYPPGIRSERDIPVCPKSTESGEGVSRVPIQVPAAVGSDVITEKVRWESACNLVHKRYFYPPMVQRLCRCPDRTECPWEWSQPPSYPGSINQLKGSRDPYTVMLSSRSQLKFCTEVSTQLERCKPTVRAAAEKDLRSDEANMVERIKRTNAGEELPSVKVNCYCPPLFKRWTFLGQNEPVDHGNGTIHMAYHYKCEKLAKCSSREECGTIRTDLHFTFYRCACPRNHLCLPDKYPLDTSIRETGPQNMVHEALYKGPVAQAYCRPYSNHHHHHNHNKPPTLVHN